MIIARLFSVFFVFSVFLLSELKAVDYSSCNPMKHCHYACQKQLDNAVLLIEEVGMHK